MKRSPGVTLIAVLALLGSVLDVSVGLLTMAFALVVPQVPARAGVPAHPPPPPLFLVFAGLVYVLPGVWGLISGIGLLRGKNWARISTIVFAAFAALGGLLMLAIALFLSAATPPPSAVSLEDFTRVMAIARMVVIAIGVGLVAIGVWWIAYLTRPAVVLQFTGGQPIEADARPLSITVIAWLMLVSSPFSLFVLVMRTPMPFFWTILTGASVVAYALLSAAVLLYAGLGLLKLRPRARHVAIAYFLFVLANIAVFYLGPGRQARVDALMRQQPSWARSNADSDRPPMPFPPAAAMLFGVCVGCAATAIPLYFLVTRRRAFLPPTPVHRPDLPLTE